LLRNRLNDFDCEVGAMSNPAPVPLSHDAQGLEPKGIQRGFATGKAWPAGKTPHHLPRTFQVSSSCCKIFIFCPSETLPSVLLAHEAVLDAVDPLGDLALQRAAKGDNL
jgi:hypothetical protein